MCDLADIASPFFDSFPAGGDGQPDAFSLKERIQFRNARRRGLVDERVVGITDGGTGFNASIAIDSKDLL